jgi:Tfp pilus assembly protein PilN
MTPAEMPIADTAIEPVRRVDISLWRRWTSFGTGVGIAIEPEHLEIALVSVRPQGIEIQDALEIARYRERPAAEWGAEYAAFLAKHKIKQTAAVAVLPAREVISRTLTLAGVGDGELDAAVRYQLDGLHPFPEDEASASFARLEEPNQETVAIGIARADAINEYATFFEEAGVDVAAFAAPAAAYYSALRILQRTPHDEFLAVRERETSLEIYAETKTNPLYFVELQQEAARAVAIAASQVRLPENAAEGKLGAFLPVAESKVAVSPLAYAAALNAALPRQCLAVNLLPVERRKTFSPWQWAPTLALLAAAIFVGVALYYFQEFSNRRLIAAMDAETQALAPRVAQVRDAEAKRLAIQRKLDSLNDFMRQPREDLDSLRELTRLVPPPAWLSRLEMNRASVTMMGETEQATEMLKIIDDSPLFGNTEFTAQVGRSAGNREVFQIRTQREKPKPVAPALSVPAASAATGATPGVPPQQPGVTPPLPGAPR